MSYFYGKNGIKYIWVNTWYSRGYVLIKGSTKADNNGLYIGEGLWNEDKEKKKSESIEVLFQPIGDDIKLLEKRCPYN